MTDAPAETVGTTGAGSRLSVDGMFDVSLKARREVSAGEPEH